MKVVVVGGRVNHICFCSCVTCADHDVSDRTGRQAVIILLVNLQKIIVEQFPSDGVFCIFVAHGHTKCAQINAQIAVPASLIC